jgi:hypothetical protein
MSTRFAEPYWAAQKYMGNVPYGVAKAATDKMTRTHFINSRLCERRLGGCSARRGATQRVVPFASDATTRCAAQIPFAQGAIYEMSSNDMSHELREYNVAVVSLYPGLVRDEKVMEPAALVDLSNSLSNSESPEFVGRAVAALSADARLSSKSGRVLTTADLAQEYGFTDVDGKRSKPVDLESVQ